MIAKEDVLTTLNAMGFETEDLGDMGHLFYYDHTKFLYMFDEDDEDFLRLAIPCIYEVNDDNREGVFEVINKVNMRIKYAKVCVWDDDVWVFFEHRVSGAPELEDLLEIMIRILNASQIMFARSIIGSDNTSENGESADYDSIND